MKSLSIPAPIHPRPSRTGIDEPLCDHAARIAPNGGGCSAARLDGVDVLVVDDEEDCRDLLRVVLELRGAHVRTCACVAEALGEIGVAPPDILISDIGMPRVDGYALIRQVREDERASGGHVPAIALTAYARDKDRREAYAAGYEHHLTKPVRPIELVAIVANIVTQYRRGGGPGSKGPLDVPEA